MTDDIYSFFVQDAWRIRSNLSINAGIRYDRENAFRRINGVEDDGNNWAPRIGFAWDPFGSGRTAIRGGAGIYVDQSFLNPPLNVALAQRARETTITNPGYPDPFSRGTLQLPSASIAADQMLTPETRAISLGLKRELVAGLAVSVDGVYSRGYNQYNKSRRQPPECRHARPPRSTILANHPVRDCGHSWYSALLANVEKRPGPRVPASACRTRSRARLRDVEGFLFLAQDQNNLAAEKGYGDNHRRHQLAAHTTWDDARRLSAGRGAAGAIGPSVEYHDRRRQQRGHQHHRSTGPCSAGRESARQNRPTSPRSPAASATWPATARLATPI
jgi:hypothetical protein